MDYISAKEAAKRWGVSVRYVQKYCVDGRIPGAKKFSGSWAVPADASRPADLRCPQVKDKCINTETAAPTLHLLNSPFPQSEVKQMDGAGDHADEKILTLAEYRYYSGNAAEAAALTEPYLVHPNPFLRLPACLTYGYASIFLNQLENTRRAREIIEEAFETLQDSKSEAEKVLIVFANTAFCTLLHLPLPEELPDLRDFIPRMPKGIRMFTMYIQARAAYIKGLYGVAVGIAETALALEDRIFPISAIHLHLVCAMGYAHMQNAQEENSHVLAAWKIAKADGLFQPFAEMYPFLAGALEVTIKKADPEDYHRIMSLTKVTLPGWCTVHNVLTGDKIPANLTPNEFTIATLASRNWSNREISQYLGISENTVKSCISSVRSKLSLAQRRDLATIMP